MTENNNVRFFYMRDSKDPRRMVTVARRFHLTDRSVLQFQFAVNNPNTKYDWTGHVKGDCPQKEVGRRISLGRLESRPFEVDFESGRQLTLICEILSDEAKAEMHAVDWGQRWNDSEKGDFVPSTVRRIARQELERLKTPFLPDVFCIERQDGSVAVVHKLGDAVPRIDKGEK
jgi:hypothetical protein